MSDDSNDAPGAASESDDLGDLARQYMDLWQAHLNAVANDKETAEVMARTMALMSSGAQTFAAAGGSTAHDLAADGPSAAAAADGDSGLERAQLLERLAALEGRVAELEAGLARLDERTRPPEPPNDP